MKRSFVGYNARIGKKFEKKAVNGSCPPPSTKKNRCSHGTTLNLLLAHLFVKVPRPGNKEGTFSVFRLELPTVST